MINYELTKREKEVLELVAQGYSNKDICEMLFISDGTITSHLCSIYQKLGVATPSRKEAATMRVKVALYYLRKSGMIRRNNMNKEQVTKWRNCVGRELGMRKGVYPKWVNSGRMTQEKADDEINTMSEIYEYFKKLECEVV